ncbi:DDB1- and CUL4-associated factor 17-like isoform X1 [Mizuhopecten yessoensis]|uniref:DDB1- and CUL4-associated factor 17-like isoform X1 n=1 Tax=Mizuhopecten yessoensis TaxID=6573 RepID=UPI000B457B3D|nr:DDB1- and CUL4-associated factor 17-like isoform X1 [Mizuhopecten yessoensis]
MYTKNCRKRASKMNALLLLMTRERHGQHRQHNASCKILRSLICGGNYSYKKVWQKNSDKRIACEGGKIYFDNFRIWYGGYNLKNEPQCLQVNQPRGPNRKIEDALVACIHSECLPLSNDGHKSSLFCLEKKWLLRFVLEKKRVLPIESVFLSPTHKFSDISWNEPQTSLVLRTTHNSRPYQHVRQAGAPVPIVMLLAVFEVCPLKFVGMLKITEEVFGKDVVHAVISQGLLITMHHSGWVRMYSFDRIVEKYRRFEAKLFEEFDTEGNICGEMPCGLPCNIQITECPPVLFEVRCAQHIVDVGGFPWHYLTSPHSTSQSCFHVRNLTTGQLAQNGTLAMDVTNLDTDKASFYGDDSGRILYVGATDIRLFKFSVDDKGCKVDKDFSVDLSRNTKVEEAMYTSSGRSIRRKVSTTELRDTSEMTIHNVDYEDDLDLLYTSAVYQDPEGTYNMVNLYHNTTGALLRAVRLEEPWQEVSITGCTSVYEHRVILDLDTIIKVVKPSPGRFCCIVYRLCSNIEDQETKHKSTSKHHRPVRRRRSRR